MANTIFSIAPFRRHGAWVFDDLSRGLLEEPFVAGMGEILDLCVSDIPGAEKGFGMRFSVVQFPDSSATLIREELEAGGAWYIHSESGLHGWLCPAVRLYFGTPPEIIHASFSSLALPANQAPPTREEIVRSGASCSRKKRQRAR